MSTKTYDEASVVRVLSRKKAIRINYTTKTISVDRTSTEVGNGSWGKIDYLVHYCGYVQVFTNSSVGTKNITDQTDTRNTKTIKREKKLNMAAMTKAAMKKAKTKK